MLLGWKLLKRTKLVKASEMDIWTGRRDADDNVEDKDSETSRDGLFRKLQNIVVG